MRRAVSLLAALAAFGVQHTVYAESNSAVARASQDIVEVGSRFQYQADISVRGAAEIQVSRAPGFGKLQVVGQKKFPQVITVNGVTERRLSLRYAVIASKEGKHEIQPPTFSIRGHTVTANAVTVTVVPEGKAPSKAAPKRDSRYFIDTSVEPQGRAPYVGEQITLRYDLYIDGAQLDVQPSNSREPSLDEFWIQELTERVARADQMVSVSGRLYKRTSLWSYALFPLRAGPVAIEPAEVELVVGSFFRRGQATNVASDPVPLEVQPLPPDAPPQFYEGNVGSWKFKVSTDQSATVVGRPFVVEIRATGDGQVSRVRLPKLPEIDGTRESDVDKSAEPQIRGLTVGGIAKVRYTITPLKAGQVTVPALDFSWFDPSKGEYFTKRSEPLVVKVGAGELGPEPVEPARLESRNVAADEDLIENLVGELEPVRDAPELEASPDPARFPWVYWIFIVASVLAFLWVSFGPRIRRYARRAAPERKQRSLAGAAVERLDNAGSSPSDLARAIRQGLHEAWDIPLGAVTAADLVKAFERRGLDLAPAEELAEVLRECEAARFAPSSQGLSSDTVARARRALQKLAATVVLLLAFAGPARAATWAEVAEKNPNAADVQFNLGTQAAADGDYATARLALERAGYLSPWDSEIETNRSLVERIVRLNTIESSRTGRTMEGDETLFWWRVATHVNPHLLGFVATMLWLLAAGAIVVRRRTDQPAVRDTAVVMLILFLLFAAQATFGAFARSHVLRSAKPVIVMTAELELREGPNVAAKLKRTPPALVPGTLLRIVDERDEWVKISWPGDAAWTRSGAVRRVD